MDFTLEKIEVGPVNEGGNVAVDIATENPDACNGGDQEYNIVSYSEDVIDGIISNASGFSLNIVNPAISGTYSVIYQIDCDPDCRCPLVGLIEVEVTGTGPVPPTPVGVNLKVDHDGHCN